MKVEEGRPQRARRRRLPARSESASRRLSPASRGHSSELREEPRVVGAEAVDAERRRARASAPGRRRSRRSARPRRACRCGPGGRLIERVVDPHRADVDLRAASRPPGRAGGSASPPAATGSAGFAQGFEVQSLVTFGIGPAAPQLRLQLEHAPERVASPSSRPSPARSGRARAAPRPSPPRGRAA